MNIQLPPEGSSIYLWMYNQGLKHIEWTDIIQAVAASTHRLREKDAANYWRGWYKSDLYKGDRKVSIINPPTKQVKPFYDMSYDMYPEHPYINQPEIENRYVPCGDEGNPLIKWSHGCLSMSDAKAFNGCKYIGENLKGCKHIVIDIDGDHNGNEDDTVAKAFNHFRSQTHCLIKPDKKQLSYHLTFKVDKVIPTMHFPLAHVDICGNKMNQIRYFKNKKWNGIKPIEMNNNIWKQIQDIIKELEKNNGN